MIYFPKTGGFRMDKSVKNKAADNAAKLAGVTRAQARQIVNDFLQAIAQALGTGKWVDVRGFGTFKGTVIPRQYAGPNGPVSRNAVRIVYRPAQSVRDIVEKQWLCEQQIAASSASTNENSSPSETPATPPLTPTAANSGTSPSGSTDAEPPSSAPAAAT